MELMLVLDLVRDDPGGGGVVGGFLAESHDEVVLDVGDVGVLVVGGGVRAGERALKVELELFDEFLVLGWIGI